jgi:hypothetical protein
MIRIASAAAAAAPNRVLRVREKVRWVAWLTRFTGTDIGSPAQRFDCPFR